MQSAEGFSPVLNTSSGFEDYILFLFFFDAEIGRVISRDTHVFGAGICIEKIVWVP